MLQHWIWFAQRKGITLAQKKQLLQDFGDPEEIYSAEENSLRRIEGMTAQMLEALEDRSLDEAEAVCRDCTAKGIGILTFFDDAYPSRLRMIHDVPVVLYYKGILPDWENRPVVGIVGTRQASVYGLELTGKFAAQIAACGALVVSGGAAGVDTAAIQSAMAVNKPVVAVLGCGVDVVYPAANRWLFKKVTECGCLISEYPPGTSGRGWHFPARNRIISGMSNGVLVMEAPARSGALNTASHALEQGRDVFAVPANLNMDTFAGSNGLLEDGAMAVLSGWTVVKNYEGMYPQTVRYVVPDYSALQVAQKTQVPQVNGGSLENSDKKSIDKNEKSTYSVLNKAASALSQDEQDVLAHISREAIHMDELLDQIPLEAATVKSILTRLSIKGLIDSLPGGCVKLKE